jgi:glycosyltransferase involved in cell wall biosynthesis
LKRILFIATHRRDRAPNQRFRFEQYLTFLSQQGFECVVSPLILSGEEDRVFYSPGNYPAKIILGLKMIGRRWADVRRARSFDIVVIVREGFITGSTFFERRLKASGARMVFDFDDAIWMDVISTNNKIFSWLKDGAKTGALISMSDLTFAGNEYLATYARRFNSRVRVVPTTIDTDVYTPGGNQNLKVVIGWSGSVSTIEHFKYAIPALKILKEKFGGAIDLQVIGDGNYRNEELGIRGLPWKLETELSDLRTFDIGIMPLPNDEWTKGKCGLKGLQYMSLEIPCVMSPVGVNSEIINDGDNGFLAESTEQWVIKISSLISDPALRLRIGKNGRKTVLEKYSVKSQQHVYLDLFNSLLTVR